MLKWNSTYINDTSHCEGCEQEKCANCRETAKAQKDEVSHKRETSEKETR